MSRVRVPIANTINKTVDIESKATIGAQIGMDLQLPDGTTPSLIELAAALGVIAVEASQFVLWQRIQEIPANISAIAAAAVTNRFALIANGAAYVGRLLVEADISDLQAYLTSEVNDLTAAVTWANVPDANITQGSVTQHQAALSIAETQITDGSILARVASIEAISGAWTFSVDTIFSSNVGVGTASPQKNLHIQSTVPTIRLSDSDAGTDQAVATLIELYRGNLTNRVGFWGMASSSNDIMRLATDYAAGEIVFATGANSDAVRIDSAGNVGIGIAIPTSKLDVAGALTLSSTQPVFDFNETDGPVNEKFGR